jgi:hypothetical protein
MLKAALNRAFYLTGCHPTRPGQGQNQSTASKENLSGPIKITRSASAARPAINELGHGCPGDPESKHTHRTTLLRANDSARP